MQRNKSILILAIVGTIMIVLTAMNYQVNSRNNHTAGTTQAPSGMQMPNNMGGMGSGMSKLFSDEDTDPALIERASELMQALQTDPNNPDVCIELALLFSQVGDYNAMLNFATRAATLAPADPKTAYLKAIAHSQLMEADKAIAEFERSLSLENMPETHYSLGVLYMNTNQGAKAKEHLNLALKANGISEDLKELVHQALTGL